MMDSKKTLFTTVALPSNKLDFYVFLEDPSSSRNNTSPSLNETNESRGSKKFMVEITYTTKILMHDIARVLQPLNLQDVISLLKPNNYFFPAESSFFLHSFILDLTTASSLSLLSPQHHPSTLSSS
ncbi:hypothetical protein Rs2_15541 [Raphanus sativus]|nr:hypothetical protein Rs2_15541 [Raphanus sativus]